jgi:hypothetical protein
VTIAAILDSAPELTSPNNDIPAPSDWTKYAAANPRCLTPGQALAMKRATLSPEARQIIAMLCGVACECMTALQAEVE